MSTHRLTQIYVHWLCESSADIIYFDFIASMCINIHSCMTYNGRPRAIDSFFILLCIIYSCGCLTFSSSRKVRPKIVYSVLYKFSMFKLNSRNNGMKYLFVFSMKNLKSTYLKTAKMQKLSFQVLSKMQLNQLSQTSFAVTFYAMNVEC